MQISAHGGDHIVPAAGAVAGMSNCAASFIAYADDVTSHKERTMRLIASMLIHRTHVRWDMTDLPPMRSREPRARPR